MCANSEGFGKNRYNRLLQPAPNTKWERDTYNYVSPEPSLVAYVIRTIISSAGSFFAFAFPGHFLKYLIKVLKTCFNVVYSRNRHAYRFLKVHIKEIISTAGKRTVTLIE